MEAAKYKVLFADDEYWTREKMKTLIEWNKYNLEFMTPAENEEDVLKKLDEERPDILITDINMPYVNGVELLDAIHKKYNDIVTFVISGYDDFGYVKESFLSGSINYLVKPVSKIDLVNALSKALEIIGQRKKDKEQELENRNEILKASSLIEDREFSQLLEKGQVSFTPGMTLNNNMEFASASLILVKIHDMSELCAQYHYDMNLLSYSLKHQMKERMSCENLYIFNYIYRANEFVIVTDKDTREIQQMANRLLVDFQNITKSPVSIVLSDHTYSLESVQQAYVQAVGVLMTRPFVKKSVILKSDNSESEIIKNHLSEAEKKELQNLLQSGKGQEVKRIIFEEIGLDRCEKEQWSYLETRQTVKRVINLIQEYLSMKQKGAKELLVMDVSTDMIDKSLEYLSVSYIQELLEDLIDSALAIGKEESAGDSMKEIVWQAVKYVKENYFKPLTLSTLADKYCVESSYFSRMFRKETGENVMQCIARNRMEHAKDYIQKGNVSLTEIAFMVGYDDYTYFNKVFRKMEGISPREYRSRLQG